MPNKRGKLKLSRKDNVPERSLIMRFVELRRGTLDLENRSVQVVVATENPVERYDSDRGITVREVLEMDGLRMRGGSVQLPIVDSHDRGSVSNVLGSVRDLAVVEDEFVGRAYFARDSRSQDAFQKLADGHLTDFSITAAPGEVGFVERGQQYTTRRGSVIDGPADIVSAWTPTDASLVATGADERSVVRRSYTEIPDEVNRAMDESLIASLVSMGLPDGLSEPNAVLAWVVGNMNATAPAEPDVIESAEPDAEPEEIESAETDEDEAPLDEITNEEGDTMPKEELEKSVDRALKADRARQKEIRAICVKMNVERTVADTYCDSGASLDAVRKDVIKRAAGVGLGSGTGESVRVTESGDDKFYAAARDGLVQRA